MAGRTRTITRTCAEEEEGADKGAAEDEAEKGDVDADAVEEEASDEVDTVRCLEEVEAFVCTLIAPPLALPLRLNDDENEEEELDEEMEDAAEEDDEEEDEERNDLREEREEEGWEENAGRAQPFAFELALDRSANGLRASMVVMQELRGSFARDITRPGLHCWVGVCCVGCRLCPSQHACNGQKETFYGELTAEVLV
jgi:hypothetical protein